MNYPKISIITPSYNQAEYLEDTIISVINQNYPNFEYIIIDGGSTDNSVEIIQKYEHHITYWISEPDKGQSEAINKGFKIATGDILCWLNSDDMYFYNILSYVAKNIDIQKAELLFGNCFTFTEGTNNGNISDVLKTSNYFNIEYADYIIQPSSFWTRKTWQLVGELSSDLHYCFDWDWFIKCKKNNVCFKPVYKILSMYRIHNLHKTGTGGERRNLEILEIYKTHLGLDIYNLALLISENREHIKRQKDRLFKFHLLNKQNIFLKYLIPKIYGKYPFQIVEWIYAMA